MVPASRRGLSRIRGRKGRNFRAAPSEAAIDEQWIGKGGGLRDPASVTDPQRRAIVERLRAKHGYAR